MSASRAASRAVVHDPHAGLRRDLAYPELPDTDAWTESVRGHVAGLVAGAALDAPGPDGDPAIVVAAAGSVRALAMVLAAGADRDARGVGGRAAIHAAAEHGAAAGIRLLVAMGADRHAVDASGGTALDAALESGFSTGVAELVDHGVVPARLRREHGRTLRPLAQDVSRRIGSRCGILLAACGDGDPSLVAGGCLRDPDGADWCMRLAAAHSGAPWALRLLAAVGADGAVLPE